MKRVDQTQDAWVNIPDVREWIKPEGIYMVPVGSSLRVCFQKSAQGIEIMDVILQARINMFQTAIAAAKNGN